ncbi:MAG: DUF5686 and carboxypeptidase regulatory-like domain-containing protein [Candidatus Amulumruptor caecigallinarius]|nr:DUF5686 and carboxypeptidase regulatory-like domain-containing protein [Candidatus Amulumruptor caecigallinarius]
MIANKFFQYIITPVVVIILLFCVLPASAKPVSSSSHKVVGVVIDSITGEKMEFVNVFSKKNKRGTTTDLNGEFKLILPVGSLVEVTAMGYLPKQLKVENSDTLKFYIVPAPTELSELVVKPKKQKYSKKNNPAVELMRRVRADRDKHNPVKSPYYSYDRYDKIVMGLNNYKGYVPDENGKVKGKMKILAELVDTGVWTGSRILDLSLKEKFVTRIMSDNGSNDKEIVQARRSNGIDKSFDTDYTRVVFEDMLREVDVYGNDIPVMRSRFVSPLSAIGADFYKYHIVDTVMIGTDRCVELSFAPHNAESAGFNGKLFIPVDDSVKYVRRVMMQLPKAANVNYVEGMYLSQNFMKDSLGRTHKTLDDLIVELHLVGSVGETYLSRQSRYSNYSAERRDDMAEYYDKIGHDFEIEDSEHQNSSFWGGVRMIPLSYAESKLAVDESPFQKVPLIKWLTKVVEIVVKGYVPTGKNSKFDFGPVDSFVSYNATEGMRFAVGGLTTANLFKNVFARGYVAYGLRDKKFKYSAEVEYSFLPKKYHSHEFPRNGIRAAYSYDIDKLGQSMVSNAANNLLNSVTRIESNLSIYQRLATLEYNREWRNHFSIKATLANQRLEHSEYVGFVRGNGEIVPHFNQSSFKVSLRYAPNEKFIQTYNERRDVNRDALILNLSHEFGPKGLLGSEYTVNLTEFSLRKRLWFSAFGYADILFKAAKLWNQVQFPALLWQNANVAYTVKQETYSLLNPMEFAMDEYFSLDLNYNLNGLIFNRIPLIKKLKLREIVTFKGFMGHLTKKNNPEYNDNLFRFPGNGVTTPMGRTPYMEAGVGIDNILTFIRLEYIWRLTYKDRPGISDSGLRFSLQFAF